MVYGVACNDTNSIGAAELQIDPGLALLCHNLDGVGCHGYLCRLQIRHHHQDGEKTYLLLKVHQIVED